jgi:hypothetical protein
MKKIYLPGLSVGVLLALTAESLAQYPNTPYQLPVQRPAVSPWLNLLRQGGSPANNYYNLVQPQFEFGSNITNLQAQTLSNRAAISSLEAGQAQQYTTGHRTGFMNQGRYFMNNSAGAPIGSRGGAAGGGGRAVAGSQTASGTVGGGYR